MYQLHREGEDSDYSDDTDDMPMTQAEGAGGGGGAGATAGTATTAAARTCRPRPPARRDGTGAPPRPRPGGGSAGGGYSLFKQAAPIEMCVGGDQWVRGEVTNVRGEYDIRLGGGGTREGVARAALRSDSKKARGRRKGARAR